MIVATSKYICANTPDIPMFANVCFYGYFVLVFTITIKNKYILIIDMYRKGVFLTFS